MGKGGAQPARKSVNKHSHSKHGAHRVVGNNDVNINKHERLQPNLIKEEDVKEPFDTQMRDQVERGTLSIFDSTWYTIFEDERSGLNDLPNYHGHYLDYADKVIKELPEPSWPPDTDTNISFKLQSKNISPTFNASSLKLLKLIPLMLSPPSSSLSFGKGLITNISASIGNILSLQGGIIINGTNAIPNRAQEVVIISGPEINSNISTLMSHIPSKSHRFMIILSLWTFVIVGAILALCICSICLQNRLLNRQLKDTKVKRPQTVTISCPKCRHKISHVTSNNLVFDSRIIDPKTMLYEKRTILTNLAETNPAFLDYSEDTDKCVLLGEKEPLISNMETSSSLPILQENNKLKSYSNTNRKNKGENTSLKNSIYEEDVLKFDINDVVHLYQEPDWKNINWDQTKI